MERVVNNPTVPQAAPQHIVGTSVRFRRSVPRSDAHTGRSPSAQPRKGAMPSKRLEMTNTNS